MVDGWGAVDVSQLQLELCGAGYGIIGETGCLDVSYLECLAKMR